LAAVDHSILRALAAEVHRRRCPGCGRSLRDADIAAHFSTRDRVHLSFRCGRCSFEGGGEIALTTEMREEAAAAQTPPSKANRRVADPITADEVISVHEILAGWSGDFTGLLAAEPELKPPS
jgi:hypothetical protein